MSTTGETDKEANSECDEEQELNHKKAVTSIANLICTSEVSCLMIRSDSFKMFVTTLNPRFRVDSRTVESIDCYQICSLDEPVDISPWDAIFESLEDWGSIKDKISTRPMRMVPQNATKTTFNLREKKKLSLKHQVFQISCCADIISQMVAFAAEEIQSILNKTRALYNPKAQPLWYKPIDLAHEVIEMWRMGNSLPKMRQPTMMYHLMKNGRSLKNISNFSIEFLKYQVSYLSKKKNV
ncbi:hypothetical protein TIFTF001_024206 [Ficus carica]|uniref:Uncharacterized protein n=1 Tax=Ficus carica TaxID=3494 RepID=A0AA88DGR4_FICCA|nr:hypothetical protein TIFTF001_024206 [Ficus carica]